MSTAGRKKGAIFGFLLCIAFASIPAAEGGGATRRFGIFIGSNNGGRNRVMLRYAISDAKSVSRIFGGMGGIAAADNILLVEPSMAEINRQLDNLGRQASQSKQNTQRTELVFYYSGHSDENGILLNRERYGYRELRERINAVESDMRIVILDSCSSGSMTRAKGGVKTQPFLFDSSVSATGYAILTSSSANEASQESDYIESSYFTHSLMAGLRRAADSVGDGRVTLNELYRFAYTETLAKTETSAYGVQHPSFDIQISGSGDVVLTDIKETSAGLLIGEELTGRISIRDRSNFLVAELTKVNRKPMELGLEPGVYHITLLQGNNFYRAEVSLLENQRTGLNMNNLRLIAVDSTPGRSRGDSPPDTGYSEDMGEYPHYSFNIQFMPNLETLIPGLNRIGNSREKATNNLLVGIPVAMGHNIDGMGGALIGLMNTGKVKGIQGSGIFNWTLGNIDGIQGAGFLNYAQDNVQWIQGSGIANYAGSVRGIQGAAISNVVLRDIQGIQGSGIFNITGGNIVGIQGSGIGNYTGGSIQGIQGSAFLNITLGDFSGVQGAMGTNYTGGGFRGVQAGLVNINGSGGKGVMAGLVNVSGSEDMVAIGLINIIRNGILHPAVYVDDMLFNNFSFRSGGKYLYSVFNVGVGGKNVYEQNNDDVFYSFRAGFGFEYNINHIFINIDATGGSIQQAGNYEVNYSINEEGEREESQYYPQIITGQLRLTAGYKIFEHLGIFAGISYDHFYQKDDNIAVPKDFSALFIGGTYGRHSHKLGFFGGIQF